MNSSAGLKSFYKPCSEKLVKFAKYLGAHTDLIIRMYFWVQHCKFQQPGYYDFSVVTFLDYITHMLGNL